MRDLVSNAKVRRSGRGVERGIVARGGQTAAEVLQAASLLIATNFAPAADPAQEKRHWP